MDTFDYLLIFGGCLGGLIWAIYFLLPSRNKKGEQSDNATEASDVSDTKTPLAADSAKPKPTPIPAPVASSKRSYDWIWWVLIIIAAIIYGGRWAWYETQNVSKTTGVPRVDAPGREMRQKFSAVIDPLSFNRQKSRGVRVENIDGGTTIVIEPHGELVYDIKVSGMFERPVFIDFHRRETEPQYVGYRVNDIRHRHIFITATSGMSRYGTDSREFRTGENEIAFFSEGGRINMNGDKKIAVYQK